MRFSSHIFAAVVLAVAAVSCAASASAASSAAAAAPHLDGGTANSNNRNNHNTNLRHLQDDGDEADDEEDECDGRRAQECGAANPDRPEFCCAGYGCAGGASVRCVLLEEAEGEEGEEEGKEAADGEEETPTPPDADTDADADADTVDDVEDAEDAAEPAPVEDEEPPMEVEEEEDEEPTEVVEEEEEPAEPDNSNCAAKGERSQQCGATNPDRPSSCCAGLVCSDGAGVACLEDPALATTTGGPTTGTGNGLYQTERYSLGGMEIEGTTFESEVGGDTIRIQLPAGSTAKAFVMMFMGDSGGADGGGGERVAYHDNWVHLLDEGQGQTEDLNCKVQHKVWAGNNDSFRVWDGVNKFVVMPSFLGVDEENPIVEARSWRFTDVEQVYAPSVNTVPGGVVLVMYLLDAASSDDDGRIIQGVLGGGDEYRVLSSDLTKSGESMAAFAAASDGTCTGPIAATSTGEFASGIAMTISLRPLGLPVEDLQDCSVDVDEIDAAADVATTNAPTASPTADEGTMDGEEPIDVPTTAPTFAAWYGPTPEPTTEDDTAMPTTTPTPMGTVVPPTSDPPSAASAFASSALAYGALAIVSFLFTYVF